MNRATKRFRAASHWTTIGLFTLTITAFGAFAENYASQHKHAQQASRSACSILLEDFCPGKPVSRAASAPRTFLIH